MYTVHTKRPANMLRWVVVLVILRSIGCFGQQATGTNCNGGLCCGDSGHSGPRCQNGACSALWLSSPSSHHPCNRRRARSLAKVSSIVSPSLFDTFLPRRSSSDCPSHGFYTRQSFLCAASAFHGFGSTGNLVVRKRELAAFFANVAHETGRGCYIEEIVKGIYCDPSEAPCAKGQEYYGRGPIQLSWNYNYQAAGKALGFDGINNPGIVGSNATLSFETAVWYWMTSGSPTCHSAMIKDKGFGATIRAINGGLECGPHANQPEQQDRIKLYKSYCSILAVHPGRNLTC